MENLFKKKPVYVPKPIAGQSYTGHTKINSLQLHRCFLHNEGFLFNGFIVGNKVSSWHFFNGWCLAYRIEEKTESEMDEIIDGFLWYLDLELGNNVAIFLENTMWLPSLKK